MERDEDGNTRLMTAILEEDEDLAIEILDTEDPESLDLDAVNYDHFNTLQLACRKGLVNVAIQLIDMGVDPHYIGGDGFKALDYALAVKEHASKIVAAADAQMRYAAEDEKWDDVCEWRTDKETQQDILETIDPLIETLKNMEPDASMHISDEDLKTRLEAHIMRYLRNGRASKSIEWNPKGVILTTLFFLHLMRTYRDSQCYVNDSKGESIGLYMTFNLALNKIVVSPSAYGDIQEERYNQKKLKDIAAQIVKCGSKTKSYKQVIIPITIDNAEDPDFHHMNLLIFREKEWILEHYEPHGKTNLIKNWQSKTGRNTNEQIDELLKGVFTELTEQLNARLKRRKAHKEKGPVKLLMSSDVCPSHRGFQALSSHDASFEKVGLCAVWSFFIAELAATFPMLTMRKIQSGVFQKMQEYDMNMAGDFLLNIIKGYVLHIIESTRVYAEFLGVDPEEWGLKAFQTNEDLEARISWLSWFESLSFYDADFVENRVKMHKQGNEAVTKEEWQNAERYLKMKRVQECASKQIGSEEEPVSKLALKENTNAQKSPSKSKTQKSKSRGGKKCKMLSRRKRRKI